MEAQQPPSRTGIAPLSFAIGVVVLLVGLIVDPLVIAPLGGAITIIATVAWIRSGERTAEPIDEAPSRRPTAATEERYSRSRFLDATGPKSWLYPFDPS
jgi:hypothetical protein